MKCKNFYLFFMLLLSFQNGFSQIAKGNYIGADYSRYNIYLNSLETGLKEKVNRDGYIISAVIGGFVSRNAAMGLFISYEPYYEKFYSDLRDYSRAGRLYAINPYIKSHFKIYNKMAVFVHSGINAGVGKFQENGKIRYRNYNYNFSYDAEGKVELLEIGLQPGIIFFLTKKFVIECRHGIMGYQYKGQRYEGGADEFNGEQKRFIADFSKRTLRLGLSYYFRN